MIATALTAYTDARADRADRRAPARGLQVKNVFAVENNAACQEELLHSPDGPGWRLLQPRAALTYCPDSLAPLCLSLRHHAPESMFWACVGWDR
eukprot:4231073-Pyramimonas_sp.AAC.1